MRVSTAALYTFAALVAHDITSPAIAASLSTDAASPVSPVTASTATTTKGLTPSDLVAPIAPAESFDIELTATERIPVVQNNAPPLPVDLPTATEPQPSANLVSAPAPLAEQPPAQAAPKPESAPVFSAPPAVATAVEKAAAPQPTPLVQTLNEQALLNKPESGQPGVSTHSSKVSVSHLTPEEIKALQQGLTAEQPKPTVVTPAPAPPANHTPPAALVSANLAQQATAAFGNQTATTATVAHPAANQQPAASEGHDANDGFSLSVYNPSDNARSYYNLTSRPDAQLSNGNVSLLFPLSIPAAITSAFGWRVHPVMGGARFHAGTDLGAPQGTPVLAALDGKVEIADFVGGYGLTVVLQHDKGTEQTLYGHLSEIFVQPGDTVKQGEAIGRVGSTGLSTGPHLHFELRKLTQEGWTVMDPGPSLEYALLHFHSPTQVAQANSGLKLPTFFRYSGKFLTEVAVAAQSNTTQTPQTAASHSRVNQPAIATRDRQIAATRTQPAVRRSATPQN